MRNDKNVSCQKSAKLKSQYQNAIHILKKSAKDKATDIVDERDENDFDKSQGIV